VNGYQQLWLLLLKALFMQISGVSLALTWPCRLCLLRVLLCVMPLLQAFPFPCTLGEVTLHLLSQACVFIYSSPGKWVFLLLLWSFPPTTAFTSFPACACWACAALLPAGLFVYSSCGRWVFPPLLWGFPPSATLTSFPAPGCWARPAAPALSGQAWLVYLQFRERFPSPSSALRAPHSLCNVSLLFYCLLLSFSFFPGGGRSVQGVGVLPRVVCGSTANHLAHLVRVFPSGLGAGVWRWPGNPPGFDV
jgi:hypothetical protein